MCSQQQQRTEAGAEQGPAAAGRRLATGQGRGAPSTPAEGIAAFCSRSILCLLRAAVPWPNMPLRAFSSVCPVVFFYTQRRFCSSHPGSPGMGQGLVKKAEQGSNQQCPGSLEPLNGSLHPSAPRVSPAQGSAC